VISFLEFAIVTDLIERDPSRCRNKRPNKLSYSMCLDVKRYFIDFMGLRRIDTLSKRIDTAAMETVLPRTTVSSGRLIRVPQGEPHRRNSDEFRFQFCVENAHAKAPQLSRARLYVSQDPRRRRKKQSARVAIAPRRGKTIRQFDDTDLAGLRERVYVYACACRVLLPGIV